MWEKIKKLPPIVFIVPLVLIAVLIAWQLLPVDQWLEQLRNWVDSLGWLGPIAFGLIYIVATVCMLPGSAFTILGGLIFGWWGIPLVVVSATIGASLAFLAGRYFARDRVEKIAENNDKLRAVDEAMGEKDWLIIGLMRLSPVVPFNLQNWFFGTTGVSFIRCTVATFIGIIPGTALYVYIGVIGKSAGGGSGPLKWTLLAVGLIATAVVTWLVSREANKKLKEFGVADDEEGDESS